MSMRTRPRVFVPEGLKQCQSIRLRNRPSLTVRGIVSKGVDRGLVERSEWRGEWGKVDGGMTLLCL